MKSAQLTEIPTPYELVQISEGAFHAHIDHKREAYNTGRTRHRMKTQHKDFLKWLMSHAVQHWQTIYKENPTQWAALAATDCPTLPFPLNRNQAARCEALGVSVSTIDRWLDVLQAAGFITHRKTQYIYGFRKVIRLWISKDWLLASGGKEEKAPILPAIETQSFIPPKTAKKTPRN